MRKDILRIYFEGADDRNLMAFTQRFLAGGQLWIYIAFNAKKKWKRLYERFPEHKKYKFKNEYNKAFLFCNIYKEFTRLFIGKEIELKNLFLPEEAETWPEKFIKYERADEQRWKEVLELIA